ncbi:hypothetical protein SCHPADRAFT_207579 [Schizopora paradoxa]|uniref:Uncharacterized protein n=1 Tax=Schizopora paradoxa TaxID=27342 RepID=A0A0H2S4M6_9AGAM|nr:hypothetical protein SCHPADRAFT_207579 [Schizopora paradoxa]
MCLLGFQERRPVGLLYDLIKISFLFSSPFYVFCDPLFTFRSSSERLLIAYFLSGTRRIRRPSFRGPTSSKIFTFLLISLPTLFHTNILLWTLL